MQCVLNPGRPVTPKFSPVGRNVVGSVLGDCHHADVSLEPTCNGQNGNVNADAWIEHEPGQAERGQVDAVLPRSGHDQTTVLGTGGALKVSRQPAVARVNVLTIDDMRTHRVGRHQVSLSTTSRVRITACPTRMTAASSHVPTSMTFVDACVVHDQRSRAEPRIDDLQGQATDLDIGIGDDFGGREPRKILLSYQHRLGVKA